jgi:hypothetical protein
MAGDLEKSSMGETIRFRPKADPTVSFGVNLKIGFSVGTH